MTNLNQMSHEFVWIRLAACIVSVSNCACDILGHVGLFASFHAGRPNLYFQ